MTGCHQFHPGEADQGRRIVLVGNPNVGKSVLFNELAQGYAEVSNYPGTTLALNGAPMGSDTLMDAPGTYSLSAPEPEAQAALEALEHAAVIVNVVDVTSLERDLYLTLELCETGRPLILAANMHDELELLNLKVDLEGLARELGVEIVATTAVTGEGVERLKAAMERAQPSAGLQDTSGCGSCGGGCTPASLEPEQEAEQRAEARARRVAELAARYVQRPEDADGGLGRLEALVMEPRTGIPLALVVVGLAFYLIGKLVAQDLVGFTEGVVMTDHYIPAVEWLIGLGLAEDSVPFKLLAGEFGVLTMTVVYVVGLLLPLILSFYLLMALLEDSGYLPRLALLGDRALRKVGLNGRAIIPLILGIGCVTMATMTTRMLKTGRERNIAVALLALSVPCSAQLGVILLLLAGLGLGWWLAYIGVILALFGLVGALLDRLLPGAPSPLLLELPRLRRPRLRPVLMKTGYRTYFFLKEATPIFAAGAVLLSLLKLSGLLRALERGLEPLTVGWLGLPPEAATAFVMGFVRRDFGAAGLYGLGMSAAQTLVALVVITLFVPCIASALMIAKEKGAKGLAAIWGFCITVAFGVGGVLAVLVDLTLRARSDELPLLPISATLLTLAAALLIYLLTRRQRSVPVPEAA